MKSCSKPSQNVLGHGCTLHIPILQLACIIFILTVYHVKHQDAICHQIPIYEENYIAKPQQNVDISSLIKPDEGMVKE